MTTQPTRMLVQMEVEISPHQSEPFPFWKTMEELCEIYTEQRLKQLISSQLLDVYEKDLGFERIEWILQGVFFSIDDCMQEPGLYVSTYESLNQMKEWEESGGGIVEYFPLDEYHELMYPDMEIHEQSLFAIVLILGK